MATKDAPGTYLDILHLTFRIVRPCHTTLDWEWDFAIYGRELEKREFDELRRCDERSRLDDQEDDTAVTVVALDAHHSLGSFRDIPGIAFEHVRYERRSIEHLAHQIRDAIAAVTRIFVAMERTYMAVPHWTIVGGLG